MTARTDTYALEERLERVEALLACIVIHGGNTLTFDRTPEVARRILGEIRDEIRLDAEAKP